MKFVPNLVSDAVKKTVLFVSSQERNLGTRKHGAPSEYRLGFHLSGILSLVNNCISRAALAFKEVLNQICRHTSESCGMLGWVTILVFVLLFLSYFPHQLAYLIC